MNTILADSSRADTLAGVFRWIDHTAVLELEITARTKEAVFTEALAAFAELVGRDSRGEPAEHTVTVTASDPPALLAEWPVRARFLFGTEAWGR